MSTPLKVSKPNAEQTTMNITSSKNQVSFNEALVGDNNEVCKFPIWNQWDAAHALNAVCEAAEEVGLFDSPEGLVFYMKEGNTDWRTMPYTAAKVVYGFKTIDQIPVCEGSVLLQDLQDYEEFGEYEDFDTDFIKRNLKQILDLANTQLASLVA